MTLDVIQVITKKLIGVADSFDLADIYLHAAQVGGDVRLYFRVGPW